MAGWVLGQAGLKRASRKGLAALILAANMPDIDVFFGWAPWQPLATHRGFTHGLVGGVVVLPPILFGLLWLLDRWQVGRGATFKSGLEMRPWALLGLCYLGALTHPLLDLLTTYSVQLLSPFSNLWFHADGLFIIDLFLWVLLAGSILWSKRKEKAGDSNWGRPAQAAIALGLVYIGLNLLISQKAYAAVRSWAGNRPVEALFASPPPVLFWQRSLIWREGSCYRRSSYNPLGGGFGAVGNCERTNMDDPQVVQAIRNSRSLQQFLRWSVMPQAEVHRERCAIRVSIGDARYSEGGARSRLRRETTVPTGSPGC